MPLHFFLLSARTFFSLHLIFLPRKKQVIKNKMSRQILVQQLYPVWCVSLNGEFPTISCINLLRRTSCEIPVDLFCALVCITRYSALILLIIKNSVRRQMSHGSSCCQSNVVLAIPVVQQSDQVGPMYLTLVEYSKNLPKQIKYLSYICFCVKIIWILLIQER